MCTMKARCCKCLRNVSSMKINYTKYSCFENIRPLLKQYRSTTIWSRDMTSPPLYHESPQMTTKLVINFSKVATIVISKLPLLICTICKFLFITTRELLVTIVENWHQGSRHQVFSIFSQYWPLYRHLNDGEFKVEYFKIWDGQIC